VATYVPVKNEGYSQPKSPPKANKEQEEWVMVSKLPF